MQETTNTANPVKITFDTEDYNAIVYIGEILHNIAQTLQKIEAKMK